MSVSRDALLATGRSWIGTPWHHQGRLPGVGLDCVGLPVCLAAHFGLPLSDCHDYARLPNPDKLLGHLAENLDPIAAAEARPGDILVFWLRRQRPQHVGVLTDYGLLHTHQGVGFVTEHGLGDLWRRRIHSAWRFRVELI